MENLFEIIDVSKGKETGLRLGVRISIADHETIYPVSKVYKSSEELSQALERMSEKLSSKARILFMKGQETGEQILTPEMPPHEIWKVLSESVDEERFISLFNQFDEEKRKEIAEYVLTQCNVFAGRGSVFSSRYNSETALLDEG